MDGGGGGEDATGRKVKIGGEGGGGVNAIKRTKEGGEV